MNMLIPSQLPVKITIDIKKLKKITYEIRHRNFNNTLRIDTIPDSKV